MIPTMLTGEYVGISRGKRLVVSRVNTLDEESRMESAAIDGIYCQIERSGHREITVFGLNAIDHVRGLSESCLDVPLISSSGNASVVRFGQILGVCASGNSNFIRVEYFIK